MSSSCIIFFLQPIPVSDQADIPSTPFQPPIDAVYIGLELMDTDLQNVLTQQQLSSDYAKLFSYQLLRGLKVRNNFLL